jgi:DNA-directed RNA polymerase specialized sigma24 family protein
MDHTDEDSYLKNLVLDIQASPNRRDRLTRKKIDFLLRSITGSSFFNRYLASLKTKWSGVANFEDICAETVNRTLLNVANNIDRYNPRYTITQWVCGDLHNRMIDLLRQYQRRQHLVSFDMEDAQIQAKITGISEDSEADRVSSLRDFIDQDPDGLLTDKHIRNRPEANLRAILLLRLEGQQWQEIAQIFQITSHSTVSTFSDRQVQNLQDYFRKYLC